MGMLIFLTCPIFFYFFFGSFYPSFLRTSIRNCSACIRGDAWQATCTIVTCLSADFKDLFSPEWCRSLFVGRGHGRWRLDGGWSRTEKRRRKEREKAKS
ncbi:hypothetical protein QBC35DRAFT_499201 [Podospora australis]|uniref:Uncharacterized protein n=1 Tax=Podospora australis TaxID=1536484 RepID=A0AAN6WT92_9PEZI|nr:hypothetical protein QBC35DRAFT_499201 [Podospora australis]